MKIGLHIKEKSKALKMAKTRVAVAHSEKGRDRKDKRQSVRAVLYDDSGIDALNNSNMSRASQGAKLYRSFMVESQS
jgi:hypothetical protein